MIIQSDTERGVRIANSGTRYSSNVREALYNLIEAIEINYVEVLNLTIQYWIVFLLSIRFCIPVLKVSKIQY